MKTSLILGLLLLGGISFAAHGLSLSPSESAGKRLYREGVSGSGEPIMARVGAADMLLPATSLPCRRPGAAGRRGAAAEPELVATDQQPWPAANQWP